MRSKICFTIFVLPRKRKFQSRDDFSFTKKSIQVQVFVSFIQDFDFVREMYKNRLLIRISQKQFNNRRRGKKIVSTLHRKEKLHKLCLRKVKFALQFVLPREEKKIPTSRENRLRSNPIVSLDYPLKTILQLPSSGISSPTLSRRSANYIFSKHNN